MAGYAGAILLGGKNAFLITDLLAMNEVPDRSRAHLDALLGQFGDQPAQGHIRPLVIRREATPGVRQSERAVDSPPSFSAPRSRRAKALRPVHDARNADLQRRRAERTVAPVTPRNRSTESKE